MIATVISAVALPVTPEHQSAPVIHERYVRQEAAIALDVRASALRSSRNASALWTAWPCPSLLKYAYTSLPLVSHSRMRSPHHRRSFGGVGAGVQRVGVRAVKANVDEVGRGAKDAGQLGAAHHAIGRPCVLEHAKTLRRASSRDGTPRRLVSRTAVGSGSSPVGRRRVHGGGQLDEQNSTPSAQFVPGRADAADPGFGFT